MTLFECTPEEGQGIVNPDIGMPGFIPEEDVVIEEKEPISRTPVEETQIILKLGDITKMGVDVIVNAAHEGLTGGGGVDGAIHKAAGPRLLGECLNLNGCQVGESRMTSAYDLPCKYVLHTVGPVWTKADLKAPIYLKMCYMSCLAFAELQGLMSIAFPCISTGAFCFPKEEAAKVATDTITEMLKMYPKTYLRQIYFVCFDQENFEIYKKIFAEKNNPKWIVL
jgi:O-acetyl-ADP-ribose deacetylase (regulator of RNase III)